MILPEQQYGKHRAQRPAAQHPDGQGRPLHAQQHDLAHVALPLIGFPHADHAHIDAGLLLLFQHIFQRRAALRDCLCKADDLPQVHGAADPLQQKPCGVEAHLLPRQLIGDVPFAALTGRVQKAVGQYAAHETADVFCSGVRAAEAGDQALFLRAVVIITKRMANGLDTGFVHFFYKHDSASFLFHIP